MRMETIWQLSVHAPGVESTVRFFSNIFISMVKTPTDFFWGMLITVTFKLHSALLILYLLMNIFIKALTLTQTQCTASKTSKAPFAGSMRPLASRVNFSKKDKKVDPFAWATRARACSDCLVLTKLTRLRKPEAFIWRNVGLSGRVTLVASQANFCLSCKRFATQYVL